MKNKPKIALCLPMYNQLETAFVMSFARFLENARQKHDISLFFTVNQSLGTARNTLAKDFLNSDCTHLFFVDSDMILPLDALDKLLAHDKDIVSAIYFDRLRGDPVMKKFVKGLPETIKDYPKGKLFEVDAIGFGCALIKRSVIEKLKAQNKDKPLFALKHLSRKVLFGEDVYFCKLAKEAGFKVFVDTSLVAGHFGATVIEPFAEKLDKLGLFGGQL